MEIEISDQSPSIDLNTYLEEDEIEDIKGVGSCNENEVVVEKTNETNEPEIGMKFESERDLFEYYRKYGNEKGFPVKKRSSKKGVDGKVRWVVVSCAREGKPTSKAKNSYKLHPISKTNCKAKLCAVLGPNEKWKLT